MQEELPRLSMEMGSLEPPQAISSDLSHLGETQRWPHGDRQPQSAPGRKGALCPPETPTCLRQMEQGHHDISRHRGLGPQVQRKT